MNIVFTGNFLGLGWDGSITDETHISEALEELGHTCYRIDRTDYSVLPDFDYVEKPINFVLISQYDQYPIDWIPRLKEQYKCPIVLWSFDFQEWGQEWHERLVTESDLYLSKRIADSKYPNWQWLSQDFAPSFLDKYPLPVEKDIDVLFTGSYLDWATERNATLKAVDEKFNLVIHSVNEWAGFKDVRPPIMDEGLPELYARARVILSIDHTLEAGYWSDRNAQIMCCGRRPLFRYVPLSESTFHDYVDYFYSIDDCLGKINLHLEYIDGVDRGLASPVEEDSTYRYAQENLIVKNRVQDLLTIVRGIL